MIIHKDFPFLSQKKNGSTSFVLDNSMLPLIRPFSKIATKSIPIHQIRIGDLVTHWQNGYVQIRRVVKRMGEADKIRLIVKADNRSQNDPVLEPNGSFEIVVKVNSKDVTIWSARTLGWWIARLSYLPPLCQPILMYNRVVLLFPRKKMTSFPRVNPTIKYKNYQEAGTDELVHLWNKCFPQHQTDASHFKNKIYTSAWYDPEGQFVATKGGKIVGFVLASPRRFHSGKAFREKTGYIESIGVDPGERRLGIGSVLLSRAIQYLRKQGCHTVRMDHFPLEVGDEIKLIRSDTFQFLKKLDFELSCLSRLLTLTNESWDYSIADRLVNRARESITVRQAHIDDMKSLEDTLRLWNQPWFKDHIETYTIAVQKKQILGYCRTFLQEDIASYDEHEWIWDAATTHPRGYLGSLYVDERFRHLGLGTMLLAKGFNNLFEKGSQKIQTFIDRKALQIRMLSWGMKLDGYVLSMAKRLGIF